MGKEMSWTRTGIIIVITIVFATIFTTPLLATSPAKGQELNGVINRLIQDGFDPATVKSIFAKKEVAFTTKGVSTFFSYFETSGDPYLKFIKPKAIKEAKAYMVAHKKDLDYAQKTYGVDKTVITAILLVESWLGTYPIEHRAVNVLATIASLKDPALREKIWNAIPDKRKPKKTKFTKKINARFEWGYKELKALIKYTQREGFKIETIKGSFAGAIGYSQFMPSNALTLAKDGNNDGSINLFTHPDAISSVAHYLKKHGWKPGLARQKKHEVLFKYNHSNYYVDTLLKISDKLKG